LTYSFPLLTTKGEVMNSQKLSSPPRFNGLIAVAVVPLLLVFLLNSIRTDSSKASQQEKFPQQESETVPPGQEKKIGIGIPLICL
jgi:hypothetical protein